MQAESTDKHTPAARLKQLERRAKQAIEEAAEPYALTDATHSRSTSKRKTTRQLMIEKMRRNTLCEAVAIIAGDPTPFAVEQPLRMDG